MAQQDLLINAANGVPLPVVSERLGPSSIAVTANIYSHAIRGQDDVAATTCACLL